jgi:hypothetical protein
LPLLKALQADIMKDRDAFWYAMLVGTATLRLTALHRVTRQEWQEEGIRSLEKLGRSSG